MLVVDNVLDKSLQYFCALVYEGTLIIIMTLSSFKRMKCGFGHYAIRAVLILNVKLLGQLQGLYLA